MKKYMMLFLVIFVTRVSFAQVDVTKFMGIPVDGTKEEMMAKLKIKGFKDFAIDNETILQGRFNDKDVFVAPLDCSLI